MSISEDTPMKMVLRANNIPGTAPLFPGDDTALIEKVRQRLQETGKLVEIIEPQPTTLTPTPVLTDGLQVVAYDGLDLVGPVIMDAAHGRLFVGAWVDKEPKLAVLAAANGDLITTFDTVSGAFGLDPQRGWLYLDDPETGLIVLDSTSFTYSYAGCFITMAWQQNGVRR